MADTESAIIHDVAALAISDREPPSPKSLDETSSNSSDGDDDGKREQALSAGQLNPSLVISALQLTIKQNEANSRQKGKTGNAPDDGGDRPKLSLGDKSESGIVHEINIPDKVSRETEEIVPPTPGLPPTSFSESKRESNDIDDGDSYCANLIEVNSINHQKIRANTLTPREQERADEPVLRAVRHLFNNRFMKAKKLFEKYSEFEPLHALGLGSMAFLKAVMSMNDDARENAILVLMTTYSLATAQINVATKKNVGDSVRQFVTSYYNYVRYSRNSVGLPPSPSPATKMTIKRNSITFVPNGILRAHVAKAEACLQIAILQLLKQNVKDYVRCGINLRRAYTSYSLVWQEYKRMGQVFNEYIDRDTVSGIEFGIGTVHLLLSSLPQRILRVVSAFGWTADKHLGLALLKLCVDNRRVRSPMASLILLAYYTYLTSLCPQMLGTDYTQAAIETLLDAQHIYPNSAFFLYFAGRTSRIARNLSLSTQSFTYATEISKNEWAEVEARHLCSYEIAINHMMQHAWEEAAETFEMLYQEHYWSPAICRYLQGACLHMLPDYQTEAILKFAQVPQLVGTTKSANAKAIEQYVLRKVTALESSGYQDMNMTVLALEYLCLFNAFDFMDDKALEQSVLKVDNALYMTAEAEKLEHQIRMCELLPDMPPPHYFDQRGTLLLIKASIQNAMQRYDQSIIHLNWIIDHKERFETDKWVVPFAFWEAGNTSWGLGHKSRAQEFWGTTLKFTKYDFEYRLTMSVNLAMTRAKELGVEQPGEPKKEGTCLSEPVASPTSAEV